MILDFLHRLWYTLFRDKDLKPRSGAADTDTEEQKPANKKSSVF